MTNEVISLPKELSEIAVYKLVASMICDIIEESEIYEIIDDKRKELEGQAKQYL